MKRTTEAAPAKDVDEYLESVSGKSRRVLEDLRRTIKAAAPEAVEKISYRMPMFYHNGPLVAFAAFKDHCSFFVMSPAVMRAFREELKSFDTATGTVRFYAGESLPASLVKKMVMARIEENGAKVKKRGLRSSGKRRN